MPTLRESKVAGIGGRRRARPCARPAAAAARLPRSAAAAPRGGEDRAAEGAAARPDRRRRLPFRQHALCARDRRPDRPPRRLAAGSRRPRHRGRADRRQRGNLRADHPRKLELVGSLVSFDVDKAQKRVAALPWVEAASVRKFYPGTLSVDIVERTPYALWQRDGEVFVIDEAGIEIAPLEEARFAKLPFLVGGGANHDGGRPARRASDRAGGRRADARRRAGRRAPLGSAPGRTASP